MTVGRPVAANEPNPRSAPTFTHWSLTHHCLAARLLLVAAVVAVVVVVAGVVVVVAGVVVVVVVVVTKAPRLSCVPIAGHIFA